MNEYLPIDWNAFHFLRPVFLWLYIPVIIFGILGFIRFKKKAPWETLIAPHLRPYIIKKGNERTAIFMHVMWIIAISLGVIAIAGPTWHQRDVDKQQIESPVFIVLELSASMMSEDIPPNRLERAKFKMTDLLDAKPGARFGLLAYAGTAHSVVPLADDYEIVKDHLNSLQPSVMPFKGADLRSGLDLVDSLSVNVEAPARIVLCIDDIDETLAGILQAYAGRSQNMLEIIPFNLNPGSSGQQSAGFIDRNIMTKLDGTKGIEVNYLTMDNSDMEMLSKRIRENLIYHKDDNEQEPQWVDMGWFLMIPMALLLLWWFRKGWVLYLFPLMVLTSCSKERRFADLWYTRDYQGQRMSDHGDYSNAAERYDEPMRKGVAYYKAGDYEAAKREFKRDSTANGFYNLGITLIKTGDTLMAKMAFDEASRLNPNMENARKNSEVLKGWSPVSEKDKKQQEDPGSNNKNRQNTSAEDLSGGGQEATKKDMEKERLEENVATDMRTGKESDQLGEPGATKNDGAKIMLRKVNDDPAEFLRKKFRYQARKDHLQPNSGGNEN
ncbi:VWA domain-containing protein [Robertkochia solimangrovi]|uniref:VWA domain-containing protein n=1 Tax=Robertkochia solimangrovi TaxID=2213046 RepID=UPI001180DA37|nr:VWA domain-containing protein [Robertkochia solimangrovi]TRZ42007.1 magnesium chelatase [Robertkochia solimangrovi]